jgi:glycosyltransferase involved in cell wall biosynthesis
MLKKRIKHDSKKITFLFISYNRSRLLKKSFDSLKNAIHILGVTAKFIVSDDNSLEEHLNVIDHLGFDLVLKSKSNLGLGANL